MKTKFGSVDTKIRAGSFASVSTSNDDQFNSPHISVGLIGVPTTGSVLIGKPVGIGVLGTAQVANQTVAIEVYTLLFNLGRINLGAADYSSASESSLNRPFQNVAVYNASFDIKPMGRLKFNADAAKSVTQKIFSEGDMRDNNTGGLDAGSRVTGSGTGGKSYNASVFTTQISVRFLKVEHVGKKRPALVAGSFFHVDREAAWNMCHSSAVSTLK